LSGTCGPGWPRSEISPGQCEKERFLRVNRRVLYHRKNVRSNVQVGKTRERIPGAGMIAENTGPRVRALFREKNLERPSFGKRALGKELTI